jgi:hypothetical protein
MVFYRYPRRVQLGRWSITRRQSEQVASESLARTSMAVNKAEPQRQQRTVYSVTIIPRVRAAGSLNVWVHGHTRPITAPR